MVSKHLTARGTSFFIHRAISIRTCLNRTVEGKRLGLYASFLSTVSTCLGVGTLAAAFSYEVGTTLTTLPLQDEIDDVADEVGTVVTTLALRNALRDEVDDVAVGTVGITFRLG